MRDSRQARPTIRRKTLIGILVMAAVAALICLTIFLVIEGKQRTKAALSIEAEQQRGTMIIANQIEMTFSQFASDFSIIYNANETAEYIQDPNPRTLGELASLFSRIAGQKQHMLVVRFFDRDGNKISQAQRVADGSSFLVDSDDLVRTDEDRELFLAVHNIASKSLYISEIHLNPLMDTHAITLAMPLFNGRRLIGVLAIDFDSCSLLSFLSAYQATLDKELYFRLVRVDGTVLINSLQGCREMGGNPVNIFDESAEMERAVARKGHGVLHDQGQTFVWQSVYPTTDAQFTYKGSKSPLWHVVSSYEERTLPLLAQRTLLRYPLIKVLFSLGLFTMVWLGLIIYHLRLTDRKQVEISSLVAEYADNGIVVYDVEGRIIHVNQAFLHLTGYQRHELLGKTSTAFVTCSSSLSPENRPCWVRGRDGHTLLYTISMVEVSTPGGIGERVEVYSAFTALPKEDVFEQVVPPLIDILALDELVAREREVSALFIQLVNSREIGLELSQAERSSLALSLCATLSSLFAADVGVSSFGYTGYLVILAGVGMTEILAKKIRQVLTVLESPAHERSKGMTLRLVCGVASVPSTSASAMALLENAYLASEMAKAEEGRRYLFYTSEVRSHIERRNKIARALGSLFTSNQLSLAYQPIVSLETNTIVGAEALVRWTHPDLGPIRPDEFLPPLMAGGYSEQLGRFVIAAALRFLETYRPLLKQLSPDFSLALNLSAEEFSNPSLIDYLGSMLREHRIKDRQVCIELTEHTAIGNLQRANDIISKLKAQGLSIAIDDFGTGYSSLSYLMELGADKVKIDRSFIARYPSTQSVTLFKTVLLLSEEIKARVVAEGVETEEQLDFVREIGCDEYQGYYFSPAVSEERFITLLEATNT